MNKISPAKILGKIEAKKLHSLLKKKFSKWFNKPAIYLVDRKYLLTSKEEIVRFLEYDKTDEEDYNDLFDCDNFAFRLLGQIMIQGWKGICLGAAFSKVHAFNLFVDNQKDIYVIEPQGDHIWKIDEVPKKYKKYFLPVTFVVMPNGKK